MNLRPLGPEPRREVPEFPCKYALLWFQPNDTLTVSHPSTDSFATELNQHSHQIAAQIVGSQQTLSVAMAPGRLPFGPGSSLLGSPHWTISATTSSMQSGHCFTGPIVRRNMAAMSTDEFFKSGLHPGAQLGPYRIETMLGAGGMGDVFRARDTRLGRTVAIKVIRPEFSQRADFHHRFQREARAISALNHPHVCSLYDVGECGRLRISGHGIRRRRNSGRSTAERFVAIRSSCCGMRSKLPTLLQQRTPRVLFTATSNRPTS